MKHPISQIVIGARARKDMGDLDALAKSIADVGLIHPVAIQPDNRLIAGERRLRACQLLGWTEIDVRVIDVRDLLVAERDENLVRKDFTPSEAVAIARLIDEELKEKNRARRQQIARHAGLISAAKRTGESNIDKKFTDVESGRAHVISATAVGMSPPSYYRARRVVEAAEREPNKFGDLVAEMDRTGKISPAFRQLEDRRGGERAAKTPHPHRHAALRKLHYPKPNREVERAVITLDGICHALDQIVVDQLDSNRIGQWAVELRKHATAIGRFVRRVIDDSNRRS